MDSDEEIDIDKILEEHGIDLSEGEAGKSKEVRIIKMKVEGDEDIDVDKLLEEHGIDLEEGEGKQKRVRIIKKEKGEKGMSAKDRSNRVIKETKEREVEIEEEHTIINIGGDSEEEIMIFQGEDGTRKVIKKKKGKKMKWTEREDVCLLYTSPSPRDQRGSRMPSSA